MMNERSVYRDFGCGETPCPKKCDCDLLPVGGEAPVVSEAACHLFPQRIAGITAMLQQSLEGLLLEGLQTSSVDIVRHCLRTYATIDKTRDAEALVGQVLVKPYVDEVCVLAGCFDCSLCWVGVRGMPEALLGGPN